MSPLPILATFLSSKQTPEPNPVLTSLGLFGRNLAFLLAWTTIGSRTNDLEGIWLPLLTVDVLGALISIAVSTTLGSALADTLEYLAEHSSKRGDINLPEPSSPPLTAVSYESATNSPTFSDVDYPSTSPFYKPRFLFLFSLLPFFLWIIQLGVMNIWSPPRNSLSPICTFVSEHSPHCDGLNLGSVDIVVSYYDEPVEETRITLEHILMLNFVNLRKPRVIVYNKGKKSAVELKQALDVDEVVNLENLGREGGTYLHHIQQKYNHSMDAFIKALLSDPQPTMVDDPDGFADHTFFFQGHLAWQDIGKRRTELVTSKTGFLSFGPYRESQCGFDVGTDTGDFTTTWSAQFVVSKRRILANPYESYAALDKILEAPEGHWIHKDWGPNGSGSPSNPALGHAVERAWPTIFNCHDSRMAQVCDDTTWEADKCQCYD
ncbi:hypothetical protein P7C70_g7836, partial [Phenoliferia sp. Uapishka_3]